MLLQPQQPLPDFLLDASSPLDFGICPNLPEEEKVRGLSLLSGNEVQFLAAFRRRKLIWILRVLKRRSGGVKRFSDKRELRQQ